MKGKAKAPAAATVINAIATWKGAAFGIELYTKAEVEIGGEKIIGNINDVESDPSLIERCAEITLKNFGIKKGAKISTRTDIPPASGLGSGSAAANATVLATLDAIGESLDPTQIIDIGVNAARDVGATITGAYDDAAASMLGGVVFTDNSEDKIIYREDIDWEVVVMIPDEKVESSEVDVERSRLMSSTVERAFELAMEGYYFDAMTINGLAYCASLEFDPSPSVEALRYAKGAGLSGTGPSFVAVGEKDNMKKVVNMWREKGRAIRLGTDNTGATIQDN